MEYINYVVIPDNKKLINSYMNLSEYFCVIGCRFIMACYVGHSVRELFVKDPITLISLSSRSEESDIWG